MPDIRDIDRPLMPKAARRGPARRLALRPLGAGALAIALVAGSAAIATRDRGFRDPASSVPVVSLQPLAAPEKLDPVATGSLSAAPPPAAKAPAPVQAPATPAAEPGGPKIIQVKRVASAAGRIVLSDPSAAGQDLRVAHLPDRTLIEDAPEGFLPVRAADGRRPFDVYARPWSGARGARVAIVLGGLGLSQTGTQDAIRKLPPEVTLAFAPQGNSLGRWMAQARQDGHEILMQLPLEPFDYPRIDPGRNTLTVAAAPADNLKALRWALSRTTNYTGVMNYMGARFSTDEAAFEPVMAELARRGLLYLDDGSSARTVAPELAAKDGVPFASGDAVIDLVRDRGAILKKLDQLEATARAKGSAVGTGSAFDVTVDAVAAWVAEAKKRGIEIVPVSAVAADPER